LTPRSSPIISRTHLHSAAAPLSFYVPVRPHHSLTAPPFSRQYTIPSQGGTIWSLAPNPTGNILAIGCQDGALRLLDISDPARPPVHLRRFDRLQTRFLSIAWGTPAAKLPRGADSDESDSDQEDDAYLDTTLVTGCSDSCLRTWDVRTGRVLSRMAVERARGERTLVWSVAVLGYANLARFAFNYELIWCVPQGRHNYIGRFARICQILGRGDYDPDTLVPGA
jgi:WD40 repeat protein